MSGLTTKEVIDFILNFETEEDSGQDLFTRKRSDGGMDFGWGCTRGCSELSDNDVDLTVTADCIIDPHSNEITKLEGLTRHRLRKILEEGLFCC